ncbi:MAG: LOG family protein [Candidatus Hydrogenedentota bacterium]
MQKYATIFGNSSYSIYDNLAYETGFELAKRGYTIVNGGYGGIMEASSKGAKEIKGKTIGITLSKFRSGINNYIDEIIEKDNLLDRIDTLINMGSVYIIFPGGTGTLAELSIICEFINKGFKKPRKIFIHNFWRPVYDLLKIYSIDQKTKESAILKYVIFFNKLQDIISNLT